MERFPHRIADAPPLTDKSIAKQGRSNFCGVPYGSAPSELRIPFYNVLWAEALDNTITVDYANEKGKQVLADKISYPLGDIPLVKAQSWTEALLEHAYGPAQRQRRAKVLVNPHAGPGGAVKIWTQQVEPLFKAARMILDVEYTKSQGAAIGISEKLDIDKYDIIVPCSGDGLPHEIFNGLGMRPDAGRALRQLAVAPIPCGSGNGISCNLNGSHIPDVAALAVIKGVRTPMDLMSVTQGHTRTLSFLSQSIGIIAHCDLGTEHLRWMGPARFDYGAVKGAVTHLSVPITVSVKTQVADKDEVKTMFARERLAQAKEDFAATREKVAIRTPSNGTDGLPPLQYGTVNDKLPEDWITTEHKKMGNFYCGGVSHFIQGPTSAS
jgi:sphingosine kinase